MFNVLSRISKKILFSEPFYGLFLIGLKKDFKKEIPTACVARNGINTSLYINPEFFKSLNDDHKYGLIKHELLHIAFGHMITRDLYTDKKLSNSLLLLYPDNFFTLISLITSSINKGFPLVVEITLFLINL